MAAMLEDCQMSEVLSTLLEKPDKIKLDIAITGKSGIGKSALINALRGLSGDEEGAAKTGVHETTREAMPYQHPKHPSVSIWELPGIGTPQFKAETYLEQVNFHSYDFFIIVSDQCLSQHDILLAKEIQRQQKRFYFVCTKIDMSFTQERKSRASFCDEASILQNIRENFINMFEKESFTSQKIFLLSNYDLSKYDFQLLEETLEKDLPILKRHAFILALPSISTQILQKKKMNLMKQTWEVATASCSVNAKPTPGLPVACDVSILLTPMLNYYQEFGLDDKSLSRLATLVGQPEIQLKDQMQKSPLASSLPDHIGRLLTEAHGGFFLNLLSPLMLPVGSPAAGKSAFVTTLRMLESFLDGLEEDAERVFNRAVGKIRT